MRIKKIPFAAAAALTVVLLSLNIAVPAAGADVHSVDLTGQTRGRTGLQRNPSPSFFRRPAASPSITGPIISRKRPRRKT